MNPRIEVTLEKGNNNLFTIKLRYENINEDNEIKFHVQLTIISMF
jgi:hypothetical protein